MSARLQPRGVLRPMGIGDLDAVSDIEAQAYSHPWSRGNFVDSLAAGYHAVVLDEPGVGLVGYYVAMSGVDEMHLLNLSVAPAWQGRGLGSFLLEAVRRLALQAGVASLWLEVRESNERARDMYTRRGFTVVGRRRNYYPAHPRREDAVVMNLALHAP